MSSHPSSKLPHRFTRRWSVALVVVMVFMVLAWGLASRYSSAAALKVQTEAAAVPTVAVAPPQPAPPFEEVVLPGETRGFNETPIYARTSGYIKAWNADIGRHVQVGELLAVIDAPEVDQQLRQAQADLKTAQANAADARSAAARVQGLVATESVSRQEGEDRAAAAAATAALVASNQANVARLEELKGFERVVAPYAGVITERDTDVGDLINAGSGQGTELFKIADVSRLRVYVDVPQSDADLIRMGTGAELHFPEHPAKAYPATVTRTASALDPSSRTLHVELDVDNSDGELFPGSFTEVHFRIPSRAGVVRLSANTLLFRADGLHVAEVGPDDRVVLKAIVLGRDFGTSVEVLHGVSPADRVIVNPTAAIREGDRVQILASTVGGKASRP